MTCITVSLFLARLVSCDFPPQNRISSRTNGLRAKNKKYAAYGEGAVMKKFLASRGVGGRLWVGGARPWPSPQALPCRGGGRITFRMAVRPPSRKARCISRMVSAFNAFRARAASPPGCPMSRNQIPKKGGVGGVCAPAHLRALLYAQGQEGAAIVFLHLSSFAMRWTVPVPMPSDLATFKIPTPFASCFRTFRSVALSIFGRPSFTPWATARLSPALMRWRIIVRSNSANAPVT